MNNSETMIENLIKEALPNMNERELTHLKMRVQNQLSSNRIKEVESRSASANDLSLQPTENQVLQS